jgi:hypothetical protein
MAMASKAGIEAVARRVTMVVPEGSISLADESGHMVVVGWMEFRETMGTMRLLDSNRRGHWRRRRVVVMMVLMLILMRLEEGW